MMFPRMGPKLKQYPGDKELQAKLRKERKKAFRRRRFKNHSTRGW